MAETTAERAKRWKEDFRLYARDVFQVLDKGGSAVPFAFNPAQVLIHEAIEAWKKEHGGRLEVTEVKGRQVGSSTYFVGRNTHACMTRPTIALTLAQDDDTSKKLGRMVDRFQQFSSPDHVRRMVRRSDHEKHWGNGSIYEARTSSTDKGGRGGTVQRMHLTEVAYFDRAEETMKGALQQLSELPGTELVVESTARGPVGAFYNLWREAADPSSDVLPIFVPWFVMPEYQRAVPDGFVLDTVPPNDYAPSESDYAEEHGLSLAQMAWRRGKIRELGSTGADGVLQFQHEYPATPEEAFEASSSNAFINPRLVEAARKRNTLLDRLAMQHPLVIGVDPAPAHGNSATAVAWRRGSICYRLERWRGMDPEQLAAKLIRILQNDLPARVEVDESEGVGHHLVTSLRRLAPGAGRLVGTKFGGKPDDRSRYLNKRSEMWSRMAVWLANDASIPDEVARPGVPTLAQELMTPERVDNHHRLIQMESKDSMRRRGVPSPDGADALALTFARPEPSGDTRVHHAQVDSGFGVPHHGHVSHGFGAPA